jgi:hypothetical protein
MLDKHPIEVAPFQKDIVFFNLPVILGTYSFQMYFFDSRATSSCHYRLKSRVNKGERNFRRKFSKALYFVKVLFKKTTFWFGYVYELGWVPLCMRPTGFNAGVFVDPGFWDWKLNTAEYYYFKSLCFYS